MDRKLVETIDDVRVNIRYFDDRIEKQDEDAFGFVKRGINFVVYRHREQYRFVPSRFVGYYQNNFHTHDQSNEKDGRKTSRRLDKLLEKRAFNKELDDDYKKYCKELGVKPKVYKNGRSYWSEVDFQVLPSNEKPIEDDNFEYEYIKRLSRKGHPEFRREAMELWGHRCAFSGNGIPEALEAAHIRPHADGGSMNARSNSILLRSDLHRLYDANKIAVDPSNGHISIKDELKAHYSKLSGLCLKLPKKGPKLGSFEERWKSFRS